jgi:hypothetical protein
MDLRGISVAEVEAVLANSEQTISGETAVEYEAAIGGRILRVITAKDSEPPLVITVFEQER